MSYVFDTLAETYDQWYDAAEGDAIFKAERDCLLSLYSGPFDSWLEVGVGTGRFARAFGIPTGLDPSTNMLAIASRRGVDACGGIAERLPFHAESFAGVLMALTVCFVVDRPQVFTECRRVLRPGGSLLLGIVPADSAWGLAYKEKAARGHPIYSHAHFRTTVQTIDLVQRGGFALCESAGTLFRKPGQAPEPEPPIRSSCSREAGFVGLLFRKSGKNPS